eukprot:6201167-Pleurochrysis_carterae.AAC.3
MHVLGAAATATARACKLTHVLTASKHESVSARMATLSLLAKLILAGGAQPPLRGPSQLRGDEVRR